MLNTAKGAGWWVTMRYGAVPGDSKQYAESAQSKLGQEDKGPGKEGIGGSYGWWKTPRGRREKRGTFRTMSHK